MLLRSISLLDSAGSCICDLARAAGSSNIQIVISAGPLGTPGKKPLHDSLCWSAAEMGQRSLRSTHARALATYTRGEVSSWLCFSNVSITCLCVAPISKVSARTHNTQNKGGCAGRRIRHCGARLFLQLAPSGPPGYFEFAAARGDQGLCRFLAGVLDERVR